MNVHQLMSREDRKLLTRRSDFKGLLQLFAHTLLLVMSGYSVSLTQNSSWLFPTLLLYGIVLTFIFAPLHECIHYTVFRNRRLNRIVAAACGFILVIPSQYFRNYHYAHHRHTQDPEKDPELIGKQQLTRRNLFWHVTGLPFWKNNILILWNHARAKVDEPYLGLRSHAGIVLEARTHLILYLLIILVSLFSGSDWIMLYWIIPLLIGQPFLRLFLLAEHSDCDFSDNMLENSRTTYTSPVINFLTWNMPYHAEHHYLASVPFHALPALHAYTGQSVKHRGDGYWRVLASLRNVARLSHK